jgi:spermidine synthase
MPHATLLATFLTVSRYRPVKRKLKLPEATLSESRGVRCLHLDTPWIQGAMRVSKPLKLELEYIQRMMAWLLLRDPSGLQDTRCVQLGLGAAAITKHCHAVLKVASTTAIELNPTVIGVCRNWFHLPENDERLNVIQMDAGRYVADPDHAASADALCVDLYDQEAASPVLDDEAFYRDCWRLLDDGGVMSVNLFGRDASFKVSAGRIAAAFGADRTAMLKPTREGNTIVLAWKGFDLPSREILADRAESLQNRFELPAGKWLKLLSTFTPRPTT